MVYVKKIGISSAWILGVLLIMPIIITLLHYINWIGSSTVSILEIIVPLLAMFLGGFQIGKRSLKKGWLEGLKLSLIVVVVLTLFQFLGLHIHFSIKTLLFDVILMITTILGSMIGINRKKEK